MSIAQVSVICLYAAVNLFAFVLMWRDKARSRENGADRIPEGLLFFLAIAFGGIGILSGMFLFRHKTRVWYFLIGIPLAALQNVVLVYAVMSWFKSLS